MAASGTAAPHGGESLQPAHVQHIAMARNLLQEDRVAVSSAFQQHYDELTHYR
ncbi:hypothetical protein amrb99_35480 [Actinomadura sp. RB99]|uniref:hypothetical protein n=1 Tax=Actinomadura sp. RB99 TaxID=2691577 RepID=UPI001686F0A9|nr:hypothetical protein [Actinomadura sp. RB99]MBD2894622.1 hypothetical protein [Actinomadura sp. RB99]